MKVQIVVAWLAAIYGEHIGLPHEVIALLLIAQLLSIGLWYREAN